MEQFEYILNIAPFIMEGAVISLKIYVVTLLLSLPLGMLCALGKISPIKPLRWLLEAYTWVFRGTPLLLQLFFVYFGLPYVPVIGMTLSREMAACVAFVLNYTAYFTEIFRAGVQSIDKGQYEAAKALGMSYPRTMLSIILPQAVRIVIPPLGNEAVTLIKDTALCSAIALPELLKNAKAVVARDVSVTGYIFAAALYLAMTFVIINVVKLIEKKLSYYQ